MNTDGPVEYRHYAVRRVNPFEGVLQVVEMAGARAYSPSGAIWQIQVKARRPDHTWRSFSDVPPIEQYFNFGLWDTESGLHRVPANPVMDIGAMSDAAGRLAEGLRSLMHALPFPLIDEFECWSLDHHGSPVALLATTEAPDLIRDLRPGHWQAARLAEHGFLSPSLTARGVPACGELGPRQHAEKLEGLVRRHGRHKTWFRRLPNGSGIRWGTGQEAEPAGAQELPALGLKTDWSDDKTRQLVADYIGWRSPQLLTLQAIDDAERALLERQACRHAVELAANFRLIPRILDRPRLEAARVEAKLRQAAR